MYLACYSQEEISEKVNLPQRTIADRIKLSVEKFLGTKSLKVLSQYEEQDWQVPTTNIWSYGKKTNETSHFGNTEQRIVDNLLYTFTQPFDIVVDPFAGGYILLVG